MRKIKISGDICRNARTPRRGDQLRIVYTELCRRCGGDVTGTTEIERELPRHVADCPMTNSDESSRTSCVCEHWDDDRTYIEGGGGAEAKASDNLFGKVTLTEHGLSVEE